MVLSNALKVKLSLIPSGVASLLTPGLEMEKIVEAFVRPPTVATLPHAWGLLEAPRDNCMVWVGLRVLSLLVEEGMFTFGIVAGI